MQKELKIEGMKCDGCVETVQKRFSDIPGVEEVVVDLAGKTAVVKSNKEIADDIFRKALVGTKFTVVANK